MEVSETEEFRKQATKDLFPKGERFRGLFCRQVKMHKGLIGMPLRIGQSSAIDRKIGDSGFFLSGLYETSDGYVLKEAGADDDIELFRRVSSLYAKVMYELEKDTNVSVG